MPCSQMISMNCRPPRDIAASRFTAWPAANARIRNSRMLIIGSATRVSMTTNATSSATPTIKPVSTFGEVQPMVCPP